MIRFQHCQQSRDPLWHLQKRPGGSSVAMSVAAVEALAARLAAAAPLVEKSRALLPAELQRDDGPQLGFIFDDLPGEGVSMSWAKSR